MKHIAARDDLEAASELAYEGEFEEALEKVNRAEEMLEELAEGEK